MPAITTAHVFRLPVQNPGLCSSGTNGAFSGLTVTTGARAGGDALMTDSAEMVEASAVRPENPRAASD